MSSTSSAATSEFTVARVLNLEAMFDLDLNNVLVGRTPGGVVEREARLWKGGKKNKGVVHTERSADTLGMM